MRAVVTGGAGFLASHVCEQLIARAHDVVCVDNLIAGSKENPAHLPAQRRKDITKSRAPERKPPAAVRRLSYGNMVTCSHYGEIVMSGPSAAGGLWGV